MPDRNTNEAAARSDSSPESAGNLRTAASTQGRRPAETGPAPARIDESGKAKDDPSRAPESGTP